MLLVVLAETWSEMAGVSHCDETYHPKEGDIYILPELSLSIQQISEKLGYKNGKCFSEQFQYKTGMTASKYRKTWHGVNPDYIK